MLALAGCSQAIINRTRIYVEGIAETSLVKMHSTAYQPIFPELSSPPAPIPTAPSVHTIYLMDSQNHPIQDLALCWKGVEKTSH